MSTGKLISPSFPRRSRLLFSLLLALMLLEAITVAALMGSQQFNTNLALSRHVHQLLEDVVDETRENAQRFLGEAEAAISLSSGLFASSTLPLGDSERMERYFYEQLKIVSQMDAIYFGDLDGRFLFAKRSDDPSKGAFMTKVIEVSAEGERSVHRVWRDRDLVELTRANDLHDNYDPRKRPWFVLGDKKKALAWTEPYIFFTSSHPGLTVAAPVLNEQGELLGVVGADVELQALSSFLASQRIGTTGAAFVMHRNGDVLAYPEPELLAQTGQHDLLRLAKLGDLDPVAATMGERLDAQYQDLRKLQNGYFDTFDVAGEPYLSAVLPFIQGAMGQWVMGVYAPENEFGSAIRKGQRQSVILGAVIGVLVLTVAVFLGLILLRPLRTLQRDAYQDSLTGLLNRRRFHEIAEYQLRQAHNTRRPVSAIMIDIDRFKGVNDEHGHAVGDEVLIAVAGRIRLGLSDSDVLSRYGGEEFAVILPTTGRTTALAVAERLCELVAATPIHTAKGALAITISLGVAEVGDAKQSVSDLLNFADQGLLQAKQQGRNRVFSVQS